MAENISLSYGEKQLLDNVQLTLTKGDKVALIARNGSGKSTFLKILAGIEKSEGLHTLEFHPDVKLRYLPQEPDFDPEATVWQSVMNPDNPVHNWILYGDPNNPPESIRNLTGIWETESKLKELLYRFKLDQLDQKTASLSGGERKRLGLVKIFAEKPNFIILDEPTNHLDLNMIEWLEENLNRSGLTVLLVTHDRYFLDRICTKIVELEDGQFINYSGNYTDFLEKRNLRKEQERSEKEKIKKLLKKELEWVRRTPQARTTKSKARVDNYYKTKESVKGNDQDRSISMHIDMHRLGGKILECHNVSKSFGDKVLFKDFDYKFRKGEKVGIVGNNGVGKTTFVKVLTKEMKSDTGKVVVGETVVFGHYAQSGIQVNPDDRVIDVVRSIAEFIPLKNGKKLSAEALLERFLFPRKQQELRVSLLSGGERRRLYLLKVLMANPNFLILDEPTNDLDILTLNILEEYLLDFPGCVIVISHDRYFLDKIADHLFILEGDGQVKDYNGRYTEYRRQRKAAQHNKKKDNDTTSQNSDNVEKIDKKKKNRLRKIEREIERLESKKQSLKKQLSNTELSAEEIADLSQKFGEIESSLHQAEEEWMELVG